MTANRPAPRLVPSPGGAAGLDVAWLTEALGPQVLGAAQLLSATPVRVGEGRGHLGSSIRVDLGYSAITSTAPASVVVKLPADIPEARETAYRGRLYEREVRFFTELAPTTDVRAPHCYAAAFDAATHDYALVLEDVTGRQEISQLEGCPPAEAELVLHELARLHARWWQQPGLAQRDWLTTFNSPHRLANLHRMLTDGWPRLCADLRDRLPADAAATGATVNAHFIATLGRFEQHPQTLLHGDSRLDNFMFDAGAARAPVVLLDWQNVGRGPAVADLGYFIAQNLSVAQIRTGAADLLDSYHGELVRHGVSNLSRRQLGDTLWQALPISFAVAASLFVVGDPAVARTRELAAVMAERALAAADAFALLDRLDDPVRT